MLLRKPFSIRRFFKKEHMNHTNERPPTARFSKKVTDKITTPEKALSCIKSGDRIFIGTGCATPGILTKALENIDKQLNDLILYHFLINGAIPYENGSLKTKFYHKSFYADKEMREIMKNGHGDYIPLSIAQIPNLLDSGGLHIDVAFIQTTMPDKHGFVNLGISADITHAVIQHADTVIAEMNPNMPWTCGETYLSMDKINKAVIVDEPIHEYFHQEIDSSVSERIAYNVSRIIENGSTLQIGLGKIPNDMLKYLTDRSDLGIHSDVITDSIIDLIEQGIINGKRKSVHKGQIVTSYCVGSRRLFDLVDRNPMFSFHPIEYVCNPVMLRNNTKLVSVTQAMSIDLTGQVCSDQFEGEFYGGISTQPDFVRGASDSPGGKSIICMASTTEDGKTSRIRPLLSESEGVTIPRSDVHYVITECGIASLYGKSISEKALALIEIAHPSFRPWLLKEAKRLKYLYTDQDLKCKTDGSIECYYPQAEDREFVLKNKTKIVIRPSKATDVRGLQDLFYKLPPQDVYTRFFRNLKCLSVSEAEYFCNVDYDKEMAFVATIGEREQEKIIGSSFYVKNPTTNMAEVAYMILHEWHGMGLGSVLQKQMTEYAISKGLMGFTADIMAENKAMMRLAHKYGSDIKITYSENAYEVIMPFS